MKAPITITPMYTLFFKDNFSLKKNTLNNSVVMGEAKNKTLETIGLVSFSPKKLNKSAKKTIILITNTVLKCALILVYKIKFVCLHINTKPTKKTMTS